MDLGPGFDRLVVPRWLLALGAVFATAVVAAVAFAVFEPIQVLPRLRLAPGYALTADDGRPVTSEDARGAITLYAFAPLRCRTDCADTWDTLDEVGRRVADEVDLGDTPFRIVTIALDDLAGLADPDQSDRWSADSARLADAARASGADGEHWRWYGADADTIRTVVGNGFRRYYEVDDDGTVEFDPGFVLVDGNGVVRGEYRYRTLADDADKLVRHTRVLADEVRNAQGPTALAYEAAHLFLCYP